MRRKINLLIGFMLMASIISGQTESQFCDLLNRSVDSYLQKRQPVVAKSRNETVFLKDNIPVGCHFSETATRLYHIVQFEKMHYRKARLRRGVAAYRVLPVVLAGDIVSVRITAVVVTRRKNNYTISSGDGYTCRYRLNGGSGQWELLDEVETGL